MIDLLTEGRSRFGVGPGWNHVDFDALSLYFARSVGMALGATHRQSRAATCRLVAVRT